MTRDQLRLLDFIREEIHSTGVPPTFARMAHFLGRKSSSGARRMVDALVAADLLWREGAGSQGLRLPRDVNVAGIPSERLEAELRRRGRMPAWSREFLAGIGRPELPLQGEGRRG